LEVSWKFGLGFVVVGSLLALSLGMTLSNLQEMMDPEYYDDTKRRGSENHSIFLRGICMVVRIRGQDRIQCIGAGCLVREFRSKKGNVVVNKVAAELAKRLQRHS
jgi:hypothetical protein